MAASVRFRAQAGIAGLSGTGFEALRTTLVPMTWHCGQKLPVLLHATCTAMGFWSYRWSHGCLPQDWVYWRVRHHYTGQRKLVL